MRSRTRQHDLDRTVGGWLEYSRSPPNTASQGVSIDPAVATAAAGALIGIVLMAARLPARRAARIDPTLALKAQ
jgi:preprotein translocase subunit Sec61beta